VNRLQPAAHATPAAEQVIPAAVYMVSPVYLVFVFSFSVHWVPTEKNSLIALVFYRSST